MDGERPKEPNQQQRESPSEFLHYLRARAIEGDGGLTASKDLWRMYNLKFTEEVFLDVAKDKGWEVEYIPDREIYKLKGRLKIRHLFALGKSESTE
jgi:hypothetical protein